jgi:hypothetical protein
MGNIGYYSASRQIQMGKPGGVKFISTATPMNRPSSISVSVINQT